MKVILNIQKNSVNTLKEEILSHSNSKLKKIYVVMSDVKESGYDIIEECLIDLKARKFIALGIDKKNTTRKMLENVLKYTKNVYVWNNNDEIEFNANVLVFEYDDEAFIYLLQGSITDSLLDTDLSIYTKLHCDLIKDKKEYEEFLDTLTKEVKESFEKLTKEYIDELAEQKLIFTTKQYMHVLPSIAELLGKKDDEQQKSEIIEEPKQLPKIQLEDLDMESFEIDLGNMSEVEVDIEEPIEPEMQEKAYAEYDEVESGAFGLDENVINQEDEQEEDEYIISDEVIDMEALVLENKIVKIDKETIEKNKKKDKKKDNEIEKQTSKKINLSKVSNIIMELSNKPTKGKDVTKIKIPNYIKDMIPQFFEIMEEAKLLKTADGEYKEATIRLEIIDVNNSNKFVDTDAKLRQKVGQTYIEFESNKLEDVVYEELDIARVIKLARDSYHIEIIPQSIEEYSLWDKMCTNSFRGSNRQYGLM